MVDKKANSASHEQVPPKAEIWYIRVGEKQIGPAQSDDLVRLVKQGLLAPDMQVWCSSDNRWRRADEVSDLFVKPRQLSTGSLPPLPTVDVSQSIAASPSPKKVSLAKWRWAKIGPSRMPRPGPQQPQPSRSPRRALSPPCPTAKPSTSWRRTRKRCRVRCCEPFCCPDQRGLGPQIANRTRTHQ